ncbi:MAG: response regulator [Gammaproteobacteria bacterium]|nr:response regulator [Gammaproteobacteria bacterium]
MFSSLRAHLIFLVLLAAVIPVLIAGILVTQRSNTYLEQQSIRALEEQSAGLADRIKGFFDLRLNELELLDKTFGFNTLSRQDQTNVLTSLLQQQHYHGFSIVEPDGTEMLKLARDQAYPENHIINWSTDSLFQQTVSSRETQFGLIQFDREIREPLMTIIMPLFNYQNGQLDTLLVGSIRLKKLWEILSQINKSRDTTSFVTDQTGRIVAHENPVVAIRGQYYDRQITDSNSGIEIGPEIIAVTRSVYLGDKQFVIVTEKPASSVYALSRDNIKATLITSLILMFFIVAITVLQWRNIQRPIARLLNAIREIEQGNFNRPLGEAGLTELDQLTDSFNQMSHSLDATMEALREKERIAREANLSNEAKSIFLSNMSHEIRTPMNGVIGITELLLDSKLDQDQYGKVRLIKQNAESLLNLINDILDLSKIEAGELNFEIYEFDLNRLLAEIVSVIAFSAQAKGLELICPAAWLDQHWYHGDPGRIRQVLINLLSNAIKFTESGEVVLNIEIEAVSDQQDALHFSVTDSGIGIEPQQLAHLFDRFYQADDSPARIYGGSGLGLAISQQLVNLMGGEINVQSQPGMGSSFSFTIQLETAAAAENLVLHTSELEQLRTLAVSANPRVLALLDDIFGHWSLHHQQADSAEAAGSLLQQGKDSDQAFDIILIDDGLPGNDTLELCEGIQQDHELKQMHLILMHALSQPVDRDRLSAAGFTALLDKPIDQNKLLQTLLRVVRGETSLETASQTDSAESYQRFNASILVVEDNLTNQQVILGMLNRLGIEADLAQDGAEALDKLKTNTYDLVFMDCQLPVIDGYEVTRQIRSVDSTEINANVPIVAMTANVMRSDIEHSLKVGMNSHLGKPIESRKLKQILLSWLPEHCIPDRDQAADDDANFDQQDQKRQAQTFDYAKLSQHMLNDEHLMKTVVSTFVDDIPVQMQKLRELVESDQRNDIRKQAHKIKGACSNVCATSMQQLAVELEVNALQIEDDQLGQHFESLATACSELVAELKTIVLERV